MWRRILYGSIGVCAVGSSSSPHVAFKCAVHASCNYPILAYVIAFVTFMAIWKSADRFSILCIPGLSRHTPSDLHFHSADNFASKKSPAAQITCNLPCLTIHMSEILARLAPEKTQADHRWRRANGTLPSADINFLSIQVTMFNDSNQADCQRLDNGEKLAESQWHIRQFMCAETGKYQEWQGVNCSTLATTTLQLPQYAAQRCHTVRTVILITATPLTYVSISKHIGSFYECMQTSHVFTWTH